jgi:DNA-binding CsgD family transcriptional regulator
VPGPLRVFLIGLEPADLDALRARAAADDRLEIGGTALLREIERGAARPPDAIEAIVMSPATWAASAFAALPLPRDPAVASGGRRESAERLIEELTTRERDVLALVADGCPNREIAMRLGLSVHTVKFHLASIFGKLGVATRTQAVRRALDWGLIEI